MTVYCNYKWGSSKHIEFTDKVTEDDVVVWFDTIIESDLEYIYRKGRPGLFVSGAHVHKMLEGYEMRNWPKFSANLSTLLNRNGIKYDHLDIKYCANFQINRKHPSRYLLLKLLEWYGITSFDYTWSGFGANENIQRILDEFEQFPDDLVEDKEKFRTFLCSPVTFLKPKYVHVPDQPVVVEANARYKNPLGHDCVWTWNNVAGPLISQSAVTLITETLHFERWAITSEKTLHATYGLTFPLWVGNFENAKMWAQRGFDTFDDIIDHSYQDRPTLLERCTRAIHDNLRILTDFDYARAMKKQHMHRLIRNRDMLMPIFTRLDQEFLASAPEQLLQARFPRQGDREDVLDLL